jgi:hypothetical protein
MTATLTLRVPKRGGNTIYGAQTILLAGTAVVTLTPKNRGFSTWLPNIGIAGPMIKLLVYLQPSAIETDAALCICYRYSNLKVVSSHTINRVQIITAVKSAIVISTTRMNYGSTQKRNTMPAGCARRSVFPSLNGHMVSSPQSRFVGGMLSHAHIAI